MAAALDFLTAVAGLFLVALGLYLTYGLLRVINLAHGEFVMVGAYAASLVQQYGGGFWVGMTAGAAAGAIVGMLLEWVVIRRLYHRDNLSTLLATWGVSLFLCELARLAFGPAGRFVEPPTRVVLNLGGASFPLYNLYILVAAAMVGLACWLVLHRTRVGLTLRAAMQDPAQAEAVGINTRRLFQLTFTAGAALAGGSGTLIAPVSAVTPYMGTEWTTRSFLAVIVGGTGGLIAPVCGSSIVAGARSLLNSLIGVTPATIGMLLLVLILLFARPAGLVGRVFPGAE